MKTKQTIAVIGATGNMGRSISKSLAAGNYRLLLKGNKEKELRSLVKEIRSANPSADVEIAQCQEDAGWEADIILLAIPFTAEKEVAEKIRQVANQKVVISISNPLNETFNGLVTEPGRSAAEELQAIIPNSKVVKAFNNNFSAAFNQPVIDGKRADSFIAGNDPDAVELVAGLVETAGFNPVIAGDLTVSRTLESMQLLLIQLGLKYNYNWHAGWNILHN